MRDSRSSVEKTLKGATTWAKSDGLPDESISKDIQHTGRAFMLQLHFKDRRPEVVAWATFNNGGIVEIRDRDGHRDQLVLFFMECAVIIEGHYLELILREIETERTTIIRELDKPTADGGVEHNARASEMERKPVVTNIRVVPDLETRIHQLLNPAGGQDEARTDY